MGFHRKAGGVTRCQNFTQTPMHPLSTIFTEDLMFLTVSSAS